MRGSFCPSEQHEKSLSVSLLVFPCGDVLVPRVAPQGQRLRRAAKGRDCAEERRAGQTSRRAGQTSSRAAKGRDCAEQRRAKIASEERGERRAAKGRVSGERTGQRFPRRLLSSRSLPRLSSGEQGGRGRNAAGQRFSSSSQARSPTLSTAQSTAPGPACRP